MRAVLAVMRGMGFEFEKWNGLGGEDEILTERCEEERFVRLSLVE